MKDIYHYYPINKKLPISINIAGFLIAFLLIASLNPQALAQTEKVMHKGSIRVHVSDAMNEEPLDGASILIVGTTMGNATDAEGNATITDVPAGSHVVSARMVGYATVSKTDIIVTPKRITFVEVELQSTPVKLGSITVTGGYFNESPSQPTSSSEFSQEEVRRSPGSAGDVSRIVGILPSVAKVDDQSNGLAVRGGTPAENGFYVDNIEIPNINHYPLQGQSGGPIGLLNTDFIRDVSFSAGGFSAMYGDKLSSIMEITFRDGNLQEFDGQLDLGFAGYGAVVEGPITAGRGSYLFSVRKSFLDLLIGAIGTGVAPKYSDYQWKLAYNVSKKDKLSLIGVAGIDLIEFTKSDAADNGYIAYGKYKGYEYATGVNWRRIWNTRLLSNTSVSILGTRYDARMLETKSDTLLTAQKSDERFAQFRNTTTVQMSNTSSLEFGFEGKYYFSDYNLYLAEYTNALGDTTPSLTLARDINSPKIGTYISFSTAPLKRLTTTLGFRYDYFDYNRHSHLSPRFSFMVRLSDRTTISGATGLYYQNLPPNVLAQKDSNRDLRDPSSYHYVLGLSHLVKENTKLTVEVYYKDYLHFPLDPDQPQFFPSDEVNSEGFFGDYKMLVDEGKARSYGVEAILQKKLVKGFYGLASASYSKSKYLGLDGVWRDRLFDNGLILGLEGGFVPSNKWAYSIRWIFAGGPPYTPLNIEASRAINRSVFDGTRVNQERYPAYHSMNLRVDRTFLFRGSNLIVYFSIWNVYNCKNVSTYYWNEIKRESDTVYQWSSLPVFGLEYKF